jgi:glycine/D-amino acid oxidase-like deaminating enzyme
MKVVVLGAGVIGTTSAYFLAKQGMKSLLLSARIALQWKLVMPMLAACLMALLRLGLPQIYH